MESTQRQSRSPISLPFKLRTLAGWQWVMAGMFFPMGVFVALGYARVLRWPVALVLAICAYAAEMGMVFGMTRMPEESFEQGLMLMALNCLLIGSGVWQFRMGAKYDYWSERGRRLWKTFAILGACSSACALIVTMRAFVR